VHVTRTRYKKLSTGQVFTSGGLLEPALYSPAAVRYAVERGLLRGVQTTFDFRYRGKRYEYADRDAPQALYALVERWPHEPFLQKHLDAGVSQSCVH
jgi:hypothetical protein